MKSFDEYGAMLVDFLAKAAVASDRNPSLA